MIQTITRTLEVGCLGDDEGCWDCDIEYEYDEENEGWPQWPNHISRVDHRVISVKMCDHTAKKEPLDITAWVYKNDILQLILDYEDAHP